jgi:hypothetical protein
MNTILLITALLAAPDFEIEPRYECFVFLGTDCPMAKLYANRISEFADRFPQIHFQGVCANENDSDEKIAEFQQQLRFDFGRNREAASRLGATRSPEAVLLVNGTVVYQGRIDDQYSPGTNRATPNRCDLEEAIRETIAGKPVSVPVTQATGCHLPVTKLRDSTVTFEHVAPIIHAKCSGCHHPGEVAPFSLLTYKDTLGWADMIGEVVRDNRMPPWHAKGGHFANDRSLTEPEKSLLLRWVDCGAPRGEHEPEPPTYTREWSIRPDIMLSMAKPFSVPAEGVLDYQEFVLSSDFKHDTWIQAVEIRPGNRKVVHHITAMIRPVGADPAMQYYDEHQDMYLALMGPGNSVTVWPQGVAKLIPANAELLLQVHYQPIGTTQVDQSSIGLQLADVSTIHKRAATRPQLTPDIIIPPNTVKTITNTWTLDDDYTLHSLVPHTHVRGRSIRVEADGELLVNIPKYDFNWQHRYIFSEPKSFKRGTVITATAVFDNTSNNPNNPDPNATVHYGKQTTDEMFQMNWDVTLTHEDRLAAQSRVAFNRVLLPALLFGLLSLSIFSRRHH